MLACKAPANIRGPVATQKCCRRPGSAYHLHSIEIRQQYLSLCYSNRIDEGISSSFTANAIAQLPKPRLVIVSQWTAQTHKFLPSESFESFLSKFTLIIIACCNHFRCSDYISSIEEPLKKHSIKLVGVWGGRARRDIETLGRLGQIMRLRLIALLRQQS